MVLKEKDRVLVRESLRKIPVFRTLPEDRTERLLDDFTIETVHAGETVFRQTDRSTDLYIIIRGGVKVALLSEEGEEFILTELKQGDFFGELSLIDGNPRSASVIAKADSIFAVLQRKRFLNTIRENPEIAGELIKSLVQRLRKATEREESLVFLAVRERLIRLFAKGVRAASGKKEGDFFEIRRQTHKELAERIGASRESVSKVLKKLISDGLLVEKAETFLVSPALFEDTDDLPDRSALPGKRS